MPRPALRSRSLRRVQVRTPGGATVTRYEKKRNGVAVCAICKKPLHGVKTNKVYKFSKTEKRPERPYGGYVCHSCLEKLLKASIRGSL